MKACARQLTTWLIKKQAVIPEDRELYEYAIYSLFLTLSPLLLVLCIGVVIGMLKESIILILPFMAIRKFSGGYHAKSSLVCLICSSVILLLFLLLTNILNTGYFLHIIFLACTGSLSFFSPIDSENRKLDISEKKRYKKIAIGIVFFFVIIYILLTWFHIDRPATCIALGLILPAILQLPCIPAFIKEKKNHADV